mmetsp:Transcript_34836/g.25155  ORF Transcript_34836/g.25155 Transcript_34836/m.25155 type:complete len:115 (-) Transcript_34836:525-869(-)
MVDKDGKPILKQRFDNLPKTVRDLEEYNELISQFRFNPSNETKFELVDKNPDDIDEKLVHIKELVTKNEAAGKKTLFSLFYAGHGVMIANEQAFVTNGIWKKMKDGNYEWDYIY